MSQISLSLSDSALTLTCAAMSLLPVFHVQFVYTVTKVADETVTAYESDSVTIPCRTEVDGEVDWQISNNPVVGQSIFRRIYTCGSLTRYFQEIGRFSISVGDGFYNLTISDLLVNDTGDYTCCENAGDGPRSTTQLEVRCEYILHL